MKLLQIGMSKSGNTLLHSILRMILQKKNLYKTTNKYINETAYNLSHKNQINDDVIDFEKNGIYSRLSSIKKDKIIDLEEYTAQTSLIWSHSVYRKTFNDIIPYIDKIFYIVRDPFDVAKSNANFVLTPYMKQYYPNRFTCAEEWLDANYKRHFKSWIYHLSGYLLNLRDHEKFILVRFEDLVNDKRSEILKLVKCLNLELNKEEIEDIVYRTSSKVQHKINPNHVSRASTQINFDFNKKFYSDAQRLLRLFGYDVQINNEDKFKVIENISEIYQYNIMDKIYYKIKSIKNEFN